MTSTNGQGHTKGPLRTIVARPSNLSETLECGHTINRPLGLGECAMYPSKVSRRRCYECAALSRVSGEGR